MKKHLVAIALILGISSFSTLNGEKVSATNTSLSNIPNISVTTNIGTTYTAEDLPEFNNAVLLTNSSFKTNFNTYETIRVYQLADGTICRDILTVKHGNFSKITPCSSKGSDIVSRKVSVNGFSTVGITATFDWYEKGAWSYVRCSKMTAYHSDKKNVVCSYFKKSQSNGYQKKGKAYARVDYNFYNKNNPTNAHRGHFSVKCSDTGTISDTTLF